MYIAPFNSEIISAILVIFEQNNDWDLSVEKTDLYETYLEMIVDTEENIPYYNRLYAQYVTERNLN